MSVLSFKLIALKLLSYYLENKSDHCDLSVLENRGQCPKINRHPMGPMGKLYTEFEIDAKLFEISHGKRCPRMDNQTDGQGHNIIGPMGV